MTAAVLGLLLAVPVLVVATGSNKPASAADVNATIQYQDLFPNPCPPGNMVQVNGQLHMLISTTANSSGGFQVVTSFNTIGLTGNDIVTQHRYVASDEQTDRESFPADPPFPVTKTTVKSRELVSQGGDLQNFVMHFTLRVRIDALGVPTVLVDNAHAECKG